MIHRPFVAFCTACIALCLSFGAAPSPAHAQEYTSTYRQLTMQASRLARPMALIVRSRIPARVDSLEASREVAVGEVVPFQAYTNAEHASLPMQGRWDFGDGTTATGLHVQHRFDAPGTYRVTFTLANRRATASDSLQVRVVRPTVQR